LEQNKLIILSGIDLVNNTRIKNLINRSPKVIQDIFSQNEIDYCSKKRFPEQSFGARFAVKEALIKALNSGIFDFELNKIETVNLESGKPIINIHSEKMLNKIISLLNKEDYTINVSITHEKEFSVAQVIIY
jgi:holo-[acyl-carrier protein] synthase